MLIHDAQGEHNISVLDLLFGTSSAKILFLSHDTTHKNKGPIIYYSRQTCDKRQDTRLQLKPQIINLLQQAFKT